MWTETHRAQAYYTPSFGQYVPDAGSGSRRLPPPQEATSRLSQSETWEAAGTLRGKRGPGWRPGTIHLKKSQGGRPQVHPPPSVLSAHAHKTPFPWHPGGSLAVALAKERWVERLSGTERSGRKLPRSILPSLPMAPWRARPGDGTQPGMSPLGRSYFYRVLPEFGGGFRRAFRSDTDIGLRGGFLHHPNPNQVNVVSAPQLGDRQAEHREKAGRQESSVMRAQN